MLAFLVGRVGDAEVAADLAAETFAAALGAYSVSQAQGTADSMATRTGAT